MRPPQFGTLHDDENYLQKNVFQFVIVIYDTASVCYCSSVSNTQSRNGNDGAVTLSIHRMTIPDLGIE